MAAAILLAGCSKEEITSNMSDGANLIATPTNGNARLGAAGNQPSVKFKNNRIIIGLNNTKTDEDVPLDAILEDGGGSVVLTNNETTPPTVFELPLENTNGNGNQKYRTPQFEMGAEMEYELFDIEIRGADGAYLWGASIFVLPEGRVVENDPDLARARLKQVNSNNGEEVKLVLVAMDDPTVQISMVKFVPDPVSEDPTDPTSFTQAETLLLDRAHINENLGLSRWIKKYPKEDSYSGYLSGSAQLLTAETYDVDFLSGETNAHIMKKYLVEVNESGESSISLSDEPEVLGARFASATYGETWELEVAIADLGDWVEEVKYVFDPSEGSSPLVSEVVLQLTRTEGNLRVFTSSNVLFYENPIDQDLEGIVYLIGNGGIRTSDKKLRVRAVFKD
mgnify:CR=1 FL=1